jgi:hypothetical protein
VWVVALGSLNKGQSCSESVHLLMSWFEFLLRVQEASGVNVGFVIKLS